MEFIYNKSDSFLFRTNLSQEVSNYGRFVLGERQRSVHELNTILAKKKQIATTAIAMYGSYERGDLSLNSDMDLLLISPECFWGSQVDVISLLQPLPRNSSIRAIAVSDIPSAMTGSLTWAFRLTAPTFICGNQEVFLHARKTFIDTLHSMSLSALSILYSLDCKERGSFKDPTSAHYYEFKTGEGGFRDFEMCRLLCLWHYLQNRATKGTRKLVFGSVLACHRYIASLRHHLRIEFQPFLCSSIQVEGKFHKERFPRVKWINSAVFSSAAEISSVRAAVTHQLLSLFSPNMKGHAQ